MRANAMRWQVGKTALAFASTLLATLACATQINELREALERKPNHEHGSSLSRTARAGPRGIARIFNSHLKLVRSAAAIRWEALRSPTTCRRERR